MCGWILKMCFGLTAIMLLLIASVRGQSNGVEDVTKHIFKEREGNKDRPISIDLPKGEHIPWVEVGPHKKAIEGRVGGNAIPNYAAGRGNGIGRINGLYMHPKHTSILLASSVTGGLWMSQNKGLQWHVAGTDALTHSGVGALAIYPRKRDWWVIATGDHENEWSECDALLLTSDGGQTYQSIAGSNPATCLPLGPNKLDAASSFFIRKVVLDPIQSNRLWVVSNQGLWLCDMLEVSRKGKLLSEPKWKRVCGGAFFDLTYIRKGNQLDWYLAGEELYKSKDDGYQWQRANEQGLDRSKCMHFARMTMHPHRNLPGFLYVSITSSDRADGSGKGYSCLYLFDTLEERWQVLHASQNDGMGPSNLRPRAIAFHPNDPNKLIVCDVQPVYFSSDGAKTFKKAVSNLLHDDVHQLIYSPDGQLIYAAHDGGVSVSKDGGLHWADRSAGLSCANVFGLSVNGSDKGNLLYGAYDTGVNTMRDSAHIHHVWGDGFDCAILAEKESMIATVQDGLIYKMTADGAFEADKIPNSKSEWKSNMAIHPLDTDHIYIGGKRLMRSLDGGESWLPILDAQNDTSMHSIYDVFLNDFDKSSGMAYLLSNQNVLQARLFYSNQINEPEVDRIMWTELPQFPAEGIVVSVLFHPVARHQFWVLTSNTSSQNKLFFFNGHAYTDVSSNLGDAKCESMMFNRTKFTLIIGSDRGIFCKSLHETEFRRYTGLPGCAVKCMDIDDRNQLLYVGTFGRGIWKCDLKLLEPHN
jgi:hypothetical protein